LVRPAAPHDTQCSVHSAARLTARRLDERNAERRTPPQCAACCQRIVSFVYLVSFSSRPAVGRIPWPPLNTHSLYGPLLTLITLHCKNYPYIHRYFSGEFSIATGSVHVCIGNRRNNEARAQNGPALRFIIIIIIIIIIILFVQIDKHINMII